MVLKTIEQARANFEAALPAIPTRYEAGIRAAVWRQPSIAGEANFKAAMSRVVAEELRRKGVEKVTDDEWRNAAVTKGVPIISARIRDALDEWVAVFGPMYDRIRRLVPTLPPKTIDFRANINNRLVRVVEEWKRAAGKL